MKTLFTLAIALTVTLSLAAGTTIPSSQLMGSPQDKGAGVAVSPAHLHFNAEPGSEESQTITVNNDTEKENEFKISLQDFNMNAAGKAEFVKAGEGEYGLSKYISIAPTFIKLKPGEKKDITITVTLPDDAGARKAAWSVIMVEQAIPKKTLDPASKDGNSVSFGVYPTFAFGIFIYQNPPNVSVNEVEIVDFKTVRRDDGKDIIQLDATNNGDGISYCTTYIEVVNMETGESLKLPKKNFTIVPGLRREFKFVLPGDFPSGSYNAIGVIDYGSDEEILTAELGFKY